MQNRPRTIRAIMGINGKPRSRRPSARRAHRSCLGAPIITHRSAGDAVNCSSAAIKSRCWHRLLGIPDCCCSPCSGSETGKPQCPSRRNVEDKMVCIESAPKHHCPVSFAVPCSVSRSCPPAWCSWRWGTAFAGKSRAGQLAIAGRLTVGSSLNGAMVSSVM
jgi:hypothetical protein